jgi:hypothetical protein
MNWVEQRAFEDDEFRRNGKEVWQSFHQGVRTAVDSFNKIYSPERHEFQTADCLHINEDCFRVKSIPPPGQSESVVEFHLNSEKHTIVATHMGGAAKDCCFTLDLVKGVLTLQHEGKPISVDDASKMALEGLLFPNGVRRVPVNPPEPESIQVW